MQALARRLAPRGGGAEASAGTSFLRSAWRSYARDATQSGSEAAAFSGRTSTTTAAATQAGARGSQAAPLRARAYHGYGLAGLQGVTGSVLFRQGHAFSTTAAAGVLAATRQGRTRWATMEGTVARLARAFQHTTPGQRLLALALGVGAAAQGLAPARSAQCYSTVRTAASSTNHDQPHAHAGSLLLARAYEACATAGRAAWLGMLFTPLALVTPLCLGLGDWLPALRRVWLAMLVGCLERAGPAFIKWGQWSATRPDLFPPDMCKALEKLHNGAPTHPGDHSLAAVEAAFGAPVPMLFSEFDTEPVASGSIAQVHRAVLAPGPAQRESGLKPGTVVAVKVRHPGVTQQMQRDFRLMELAAQLTCLVPGLSDLRLDESIRQFGAPLHEQLDLEKEARNLDHFNHNFRQWRYVSFPVPVHPLVSSDVLVESFEEGELISKFVHKPGHKDNPQIARMGMSMYLQMLLHDNLIHADLHPGNILVRAVDPSSTWGRLASALSINFQPALTLLDAGMMVRLENKHRGSLVRFLQGMSHVDGALVGQAILEMSEDVNVKEGNPAFVASMADMFAALDSDRIREDTAQVINDMMACIRNHQVTLTSEVSTVVVTTMVLEGWATTLHPEVRILEHLKEVLPAPWAKRIDTCVDRVMKSGSLAAATF